jgi:cytochrome c biogenesis protein CcdA
VSDTVSYAVLKGAISFVAGTMVSFLIIGLTFQWVYHCLRLTLREMMYLAIVVIRRLTDDGT